MEGFDTLRDAPDAQVCAADGNQRLLSEASAGRGVAFLTRPQTPKLTVVRVDTDRRRLRNLMLPQWWSRGVSIKFLWRLYGLTEQHAKSEEGPLSCSSIWAASDPYL